MKFEPVYFRQKTADHYGKRGISWHGSSVITFYTSVKQAWCDHGLPGEVD
jgi:hypothetical protein